LIGAILVRLGEAWLVCAVIQLVLWFVQERTRNAGIVDVGWAASFTAVAALFGLTADTSRLSFLPIGLVVVLWSTRLASYLVTRGAATGTEEGRYVTLRQRWALHANKRFFVFFQAQAALAAVLSIAFVVPFVTEAWDNGALRILGVIMSLGGVFGEAMADAQLARWKRDPANRGKVCDTGLWSYSRHPNYFFQWMMWMSYLVFALASPYGYLAIISPAIILYLLLRVTGIPITEEQSIRSRGDAFREYQKTTSAFVPWFKKKG